MLLAPVIRDVRLQDLAAVEDRRVGRAHVEVDDVADLHAVVPLLPQDDLLLFEGPDHIVVLGVGRHQPVLYVPGTCAVGALCAPLQVPLDRLPVAVRRQALHMGKDPRVGGLRLPLIDMVRKSSSHEPLRRRILGDPPAVFLAIPVPGVDEIADQQIPLRLQAVHAGVEALAAGLAVAAGFFQVL